VSASLATQTNVFQAVAALHSDAGVLSVYVDSRPERKLHGRPDWEISLRAGLAEASTGFATHHPDIAARARAQIAALEPAIAELIDPSGPGRGRALFSAVDGETVGPLWTQRSFPDRVVLDELPYLAPLIGAIDDARPSGVAVVSANRLRIVEVRGEEAEDVAMFAFDDGAAEWRELRGPAGGSRGTYESASQEDLFERRRERHRDRWLGGMGVRLAELCKSRGWDHTLVLADPKTAKGLIEHAPSVHGVVIGHGTHSGTADAIASQVRADLAGLRQRVRAELVRQATDAALSGSRGAVGWDDVATVLEEGRVQRLLIDPSLAPPRPPASAAASIDDLLVKAVRTDAEVLPVDGGAARMLAPHGGIAATLRW
jgi:Bacterial archaeo-eukaryotic release factor family 10